VENVVEKNFLVKDIIKMALNLTVLEIQIAEKDRELSDEVFNIVNSLMDILPLRSQEWIIEESTKQLQEHNKNSNGLQKDVFVKILQDVENLMENITGLDNLILPIKDILIKIKDFLSLISETKISKYKGFTNVQCEFYPCHSVTNFIHPKEFNCMFCYCPLYWLECPGKFELITDTNGFLRKDCKSCRLPHDGFDKSWDLMINSKWQSNHKLFSVVSEN
jgi:Zn-finger protein